MTGLAPADVSTAVADAHRRGWALVLAATLGVARDLNLAEECVQEAYAAALTGWPGHGIPAAAAPGTRGSPPAGREDDVGVHQSHQPENEAHLPTLELKRLPADAELYRTQDFDLHG